MNVLILGSGAREHTIAWKISQSPKCDRLFVFPGNGGTLEYELDEPPKNLRDLQGISATISKLSIEVLIVGPEQPLAEGLVDGLKEVHSDLIIVGPTKQGATIESSKNWSKEFMARHKIPTASYLTVNQQELNQGLEFIDQMQPPVVLKADGLAAGKGVLICQTIEEAKSDLEQMLCGQFGDASSQVVIESFLDGIEYSVFAMVNGLDYILLPEAKDYKRVGEGDTGLNTGGMGAISPVPFYDDALKQKTIDRVIKPTIAGLNSEGIPYFGFIFFGLISVEGEPYVIEYNCRLGDPETEAIMPRLESDLLQHILDLDQHKAIDVGINSDHTTCVIMASGGYPLAYEKGKTIDLSSTSEAGFIFHSGTKYHSEKLETNGGRVLAVVGKGKGTQASMDAAYKLIKGITFDKQYFRRDIGFDIVNMNY